MLLSYFEDISDHWGFAVSIMVILIVIIIYFEHRRWNYQWEYPLNQEYKPRSQWFVIYQDYLQWFAKLNNDPQKMVAFIQKNLLDYYESTYPELEAKGYERRGNGRVRPYLQIIKDTEVKRFMLNPKEWIEPHLIGKEQYFVSRDIKFTKIGLGLLVPALHDLHQRIYNELGEKISSKWNSFYGLAEVWEHEWKVDRRNAFLRMLFLDLFVFIALIFLMFQFLTSETTPFYLLLLTVITLLLAAVLLVFFVQKNLIPIIENIIIRRRQNNKEKKENN